MDVTIPKTLQVGEERKILYLKVCYVRYTCPCV